jgi:hypothetical protein
MKSKRCPKCSELMELVTTARERVYSCACGKVIRVPINPKEEDDPPDIALPARKPPRRKSFKRRAQKNILIDYYNYFNDSFGIAGFVMLGLLVVWFFGLMGTCLLPPAMILLIGVGILAVIGGHIWLVVIGFQESTMAGLLVLAGPAIPFVGGLLVLIYAIMNIGETWKALLLQLIGILIIISAVLAGAFSPIHLLHR